MRRLIVILLIFVLGYLGIVYFGRLPDRFILFPQTGSEDAHGAVQKLIPFEKGVLQIWVSRTPLAQSRGPDFYILHFFGNADRAERWMMEKAKSWETYPAELWGLNYPGYGASTGPARLNKMGPAALAAYDALKKEASGRPILLFGASIGTTAALHVASHRPIAGVLLHNPLPLKQMIPGRYGWWNLWLMAGPVAFLIPQDLDSITQAQKVNAPAIFILSEKDEVVPLNYQQQIVEAYGGKKKIILAEGALHNSPWNEKVQKEFGDAFYEFWGKR